MTTMYHTKLWLLLCIILWTWHVHAQSMFTQASTASGGNATGTGGNASFAIGQAIYSSSASGSNTSNVGVVQFINTPAPLPISLVYFEASYLANKGQVLLAWETATEQENSHFILERSIDAHIFQPIGQVNGAGNSNIALLYKWIDVEPIEGISYYRLKQVDYDGQYSYSPVRSVYISQNIGIAQIYPNPAHEHITIHLSTVPTKNTICRLVDSTGKAVAEIQLHNSQQTISLKYLPTGLYVLQVISSSYQKQVFKIIKY